MNDEQKIESCRNKSINCRRKCAELVTLLWAALAVVLFVFGIYNHCSSPRLAAILLVSIKLGKLIIFATTKFTTVQKIVAYPSTHCCWFFLLSEI